MRKITLRPGCKVNLGLHITGILPDGYHTIDTVMMPVGWSDTLTINPSESGSDSLVIKGRPVDCPMERNLVYRAVMALRDSGMEVPPVEIELTKVVPDGAGLGGGSADAAATLTGLRALFGLEVSDERLAAMAFRLGCDCPFFLRTAPQRASGKGEVLTPVDLSRLAGMRIVVVKPPVSMPTSEAYAGAGIRPDAPDISHLVCAPVEEWKNVLFNDFERSVFPRLPLTAEIKETLYRMGAVYASLTGSGSAVFGLFMADTMPVMPPQLTAKCDIFTSKISVFEP